ncbi:MAG: hypothetical protein AB4426_02275 [Xenococcaceae cyanobacterium]
MAEKVNPTVATLRIWDKTGKLPAKRLTAWTSLLYR